MLTHMLRKMGLMADHGASDQAYYEAYIEDGLLEHDRLIERLLRAARASGSTRSLSSSADNIRANVSKDAMFDLVDNMKHKF